MYFPTNPENLLYSLSRAQNVSSVFESSLLIVMEADERWITFPCELCITEQVETFTQRWREICYCLFQGRFWGFLAEVRSLGAERVAACSLSQYLVMYWTHNEMPRLCQATAQPSAFATSFKRQQPLSCRNTNPSWFSSVSLLKLRIAWKRVRIPIKALIYFRIFCVSLCNMLYHFCFI
jgi:hypothetical protein